MKYEDIQKVNSGIKTKPIKGKEYAEVKERINAFRKLYPEGFIKTDIVHHEDKLVIIHAQVGFYAVDQTVIQKGTETDDPIIATKRTPIILGEGTAYEIEGSSNINNGSYIENCETSAVGRALGMVGIGIDVAIASADEMRYAGYDNEVPAAPVQTKPVNDTEMTALKEQFNAICKNHKLNGGAILKYYDLTPKSITKEQLVQLVSGIEGMLSDPKAINELPKEWRMN